MRRTTLRCLLGFGLLAGTLGLAGQARAAGEVVVSASPREVRVGQVLEILVRTFIPLQPAGVPALSDPREPYPGPSAVYNVLFPWDDYAFDVTATHQDGTVVAVTLARDPADSTLWRGTTSLPKPGAWTVWVRNFPAKGPGSTTSVVAEAGPPGTMESSSWTAVAGGAGLAGALGTFAGFVLAGRLRRSHASQARSDHPMTRPPS